MKWRTRIAPTPSGYLHLGNAFNFLLTWLHAKKEGGTVALRIDDGDATRSRPEFVEDIFYTLEWLGIVPDEGPSGPEDFYKNYSQQLRQARYRQLLEQLVSGDHAYACACSRAEIREASKDGLYPGICREKMKTQFPRPFSMRARLDHDATEVSFKNPEGKNEKYALRQKMGDYVLWRKDNLAAYHLASVADDEAMRINLIVRGKDLYNSTAAQMWLAEKLRFTYFPSARFIHHALVKDENNQKLSKSEGALALKTIREAGNLPREVYQRFASWLGMKDASCENISELKEVYILYFEENI